MCSRLNCRFVHLTEDDKVEVYDQRVAVCRDHANDQCRRKQCKYYHIPVVLPPANIMAAIINNSNNSKNNQLLAAKDHQHQFSEQDDLQQQNRSTTITTSNSYRKQATMETTENNDILITKTKPQQQRQGTKNYTLQQYNHNPQLACTSNPVQENSPSSSQQLAHPVDSDILGACNIHSSLSAPTYASYPSTSALLFRSSSNAASTTFSLATRHPTTSWTTTVTNPLAKEFCESNNS